MIATLADPILPIFAALVIGYALARAGLVGLEHARAINRYVFYLAAPSLLISVIASAELAQEIDAVEVGRYLAELAEVMLDGVYRLASNALQQKHGRPQCSVDGKRRDAEFAVIGYGKLGGYELHY